MRPKSKLPSNPVNLSPMPDPQIQAPPKLADALFSLAGFVLASLFPAIPAPAWVAILTAIRNGDILLADLEAFCASKGITIDYQPSDFPQAPPGQTNEANFTVGDKAE